MVEEPIRASDEQKEATFRRGAFPRETLSRALELPQVIYRLGQGQPVRRLKVLAELNRSPSSSSSRTLIAAANGGYGLISGSSGSEFLALTERGRAVVSSHNEASLQALYDALYHNPIFVDFVSRYVDKNLPRDDMAIEALQDNHQLSVSDASACWEVIQQNLRDYGMVQAYSGRDMVVSREVAYETATGADGRDPRPDGPEPTLDPERLIEGRSGNNSRRQWGLQFNIQVVLPENATAETYDQIFKSIAIHLLDHDE